jgi:hypothetical protein
LNLVVEYPDICEVERKFCSLDSSERP